MPAQRIPAQRIPAVTVNCDCNNVVLEAYELDPDFIFCQCELCQLVHAGPGFGAHCNGIKIMAGAEYITIYKSQRVPMAAWHFCSRCGTKLYFTALFHLRRGRVAQPARQVRAVGGDPARQ